MAEARKRKKRTNDRDPQKQPLSTEDKVTQLFRREHLYKAATRWGGSIEEWARETGVTDRTIRRWLKDPGCMDAESVDRTCALFGVSLEYLQSGGVHYRGLWSVSPWGRPTSAERDRMDACTLVEAYAQLDAADQRLVTSIVVGMLDKKHVREWYVSDTERYQRIILGLIDGNVSDDDMWWFRGEVHDPSDGIDLSLEERLELEQDAIDEAKRALEGAKLNFEEQQRQIKRRDAEARRVASEMLDGEAEPS